MRRLTLGPGLPDGLTPAGLGVGRTSRPGRESRLSSGRLAIDKGRGGIPPMEEGWGEGIPGSGLNASEGRALWKNLSHQAQGFGLWEAGGCSPTSLDPLLSNSLKQYVHTESASWRRKKYKRHTHTPHAHHTRQCPRWLTLRSRPGEGATLSGPEGRSPGGLPENRGPEEMEHVHPSLPSPRQGLGKAKARARRPQIAFQASLMWRKRGGNWFLPREAIKQYGETINTSCQFTYSFFNLFLYFISLQILSVCLTYILYIFIYQYNASL